MAAPTAPSASATSVTRKAVLDHGLKSALMPVHSCSYGGRPCGRYREGSAPVRDRLSQRRYVAGPGSQFQRDGRRETFHGGSDLASALPLPVPFRMRIVNT